MDQGKSFTDSQSSIAKDTPTPEAAPESSSAEDQFRRAAMWLVGCFTLVVISLVLYAFVKYGKAEALWIPVAKEHFAAVVGLPSASLASFIVVLVLRISAGPIEFEAWGLKFKGAAAPIVFWILCYLSIAASIKMLW
jgi:hypothetical protein